MKSLSCSDYDFSDDPDLNVYINEMMSIFEDSSDDV